MLRLAVIGIGNSGANILTDMRIPGQLFLFGGSANPPGQQIQALPAKKLPLLASHYDCIFITGDPCEPDFGPLLRYLSSYLSNHISFVGAFLLRGQDGPIFKARLCEIARHANCCFHYENTPGSMIGASLYLQRIIDLFLNADSGNCACIDMADAAALLRRNLDAFVCSAIASGESRSMQAARVLSEQIAACRASKIASSLLHISFPRQTALSEIANCCKFLERHSQLGSWLFSASRTANPSFRIDILCASPIGSPKD